MTDPLAITLDRAAEAPLAVQIHGAIRDAIRDGRLAGGARLPSWRDLAAQLGVARGTVRAAYDRLSDEQLIMPRGAAGTCVAAGLASPSAAERPVELPLLPDIQYEFEAPPLPFQMGVPAQDAFPFKLWSRLLARSARRAAAAPVSYPDARGHPELRREIAAYLALARGIACTPGQVLVTSGYAGALGLALQALGLAGGTAWLEEPAFPLTRGALQLARLATVPVPVDDEGIDVAAGISRAADAKLAVVTPGQQAPLGVTLSRARRLALIDWARASGAWIIEDDYLSELQLKGRAAPALAALDPAGQVLHAGSFSKTISPTLRLGFLVAPPALAPHLGEVAAMLAPAPSAAIQLAVAAFLAEGHYLRHLRRMKRLYAARRDALVAALRAADGSAEVLATGGLAVRLMLPDDADDLAITRAARAVGLAPIALSPWYAGSEPRRGLLLAVTNLDERRLNADCTRLMDLVHSRNSGASA